jgi:hypothetical protein
MTRVEIVDEHIRYVTHDGFGGLDLKTASQVWSSNPIGVLTGTSKSYIEAEQNHEEHVPIGWTNLESHHFTPSLSGLAKIPKRSDPGHKRFFFPEVLSEARILDETMRKRPTLNTRTRRPESRHQAKT